MQRIVKNCIHVISKIFQGLSRLLGGIVILGALCIWALFAYLQRTHDASTDLKYSEIYHQTFETQKELSLCQWSDTKEMFLSEYGSTGQRIANIKKGTKLQVKKIIWYDKAFVGKQLKIFVEIDDPQFSKYTVTSKKKINAYELTVNYPREPYVDELARFNPDCLRNVELTLFRAVQYNNLDAIKSLAERGSDLDQKDLDGRSLLHFARQKDIVQYLLEHGAHSDLTDKWGRTPLHYLKSLTNLDVVKLLIAKTDNLDQKDEDGNTPLTTALDARNFDIAALLLEAGANPQQKDKYGSTLLHIACVSEELKMVRWLIQKGVGVQQTDDSGQTALHYACYRTQVEIVRLLLENGASPYQADNEGLTPLQIAQQRSSPEVVEMLKAARKPI